MSMVFCLPVANFCPRINPTLGQSHILCFGLTDMTSRSQAEQKRNECCGRGRVECIPRVRLLRCPSGSFNMVRVHRHFLMARFIPLLIFLLGLSALAQKTQTFSPKAQARITKEVRHQILMLPDFGTFDTIAFNLAGYDVTLDRKSTR